MWYQDVMLRVAIIGAGPSGYFVAGEVLKRFPGAAVFLHEKRAKPYGLVRYGVAPDHVLTKRAVKTFEQIAAQPGFHYLGHVEVGRDLPLAELRTQFDAVVVCTGAEHPRLPDLPGLPMRGVLAALDFSRWTNGEGDAVDGTLFDGAERAVIVGNGNVALDAARMLARPDEAWDGTEIAPNARAALRRTRFRRITIAGRRGPEDAQFTAAELQEVLNLPGWKIVAPQGLPPGFEVPASSADRVIEFVFHARPVRVTGDNRAREFVFEPGPSSVATDLVIFATGQRGEAMEGLPFDEERGVIPNDRGRVTGVPGVYVCGWIKRGAKGLIGHNRKDAIETVARMTEDLAGKN